MTQSLVISMVTVLGKARPQATSTAFSSAEGTGQESWVPSDST